VLDPARRLVDAARPGRTALEAEHARSLAKVAMLVAAAVTAIALIHVGVGATSNQQEPPVRVWRGSGRTDHAGVSPATPSVTSLSSVSDRSQPLRRSFPPPQAIAGLASAVLPAWRIPKAIMICVMPLNSAKNPTQKRIRYARCASA
jgi:hypothetical protein